MGSASTPFFSGADHRLFFSRGDTSDPRLGDSVKALDVSGDAKQFQTALKNALQSPSQAQDALKGRKELSPHQSTDERPASSYIIAGYPDDEGIRTNGGRSGAASGPNSVRKYLYKMTPALLRSEPTLPLMLDIGNLDLSPSLIDRHSRVQSMVQTALSEGTNWIGLGGGHDYGFPDAAGFIEWARTQNERPLILNFDAHLDVRDPERGLSSGTPFYRMLNAYPDVDFAEIGIQTQCNSRAHLNWVKSKGARVITQEEILISGETFANSVLNLLNEWILKPRPVFLSVDIDGFSSQVAPGCSQSWSTGFLPHEFFSLLAVLLPRLDVKVLGIYEVAPALDHDDHTSKLAAQIIHRVITQ